MVAASDRKKRRISGVMKLASSVALARRNATIFDLCGQRNLVRPHNAEAHIRLTPARRCLRLISWRCFFI